MGKRRPSWIIRNLLTWVGATCKHCGHNEKTCGSKEVDVEIESNGEFETKTIETDEESEVEYEEDDYSAEEIDTKTSKLSKTTKAAKATKTQKSTKFREDQQKTKVDDEVEAYSDKDEEEELEEEEEIHTENVSEAEVEDEEDSEEEVDVESHHLEDKTEAEEDFSEEEETTVKAKSFIKSNKPKSDYKNKKGAANEYYGKSKSGKKSNEAESGYKEEIDVESYFPREDVETEEDCPEKVYFNHLIWLLFWTACTNSHWSFLGSLRGWGLDRNGGWRARVWNGIRLWWGRHRGRVWIRARGMNVNINFPFLVEKNCYPSLAAGSSSKDYETDVRDL